MAGADQVVYNVYGAVAMKPGMQIGPKNAWREGTQNMAVMLGNFGTSGIGGSWVNVKNRYLGIEFKIKGQTHFGWARLNVGFGGGTLTGYAYETEPNKPIRAGDTGPVAEDRPPEIHSAPAAVATLRPATLGLLALGSAGLDIWRKEQAIADLRLPIAD